MVKLIVFLGVQLSGKTTFAKRVSRILDVRLISIDFVRLNLYGHLSGPRDWVDERSKMKHDEQTKFAYDVLFKHIRSILVQGKSVITEMPHLGDREEYLIKTASEFNAELKIIWCYISEDSDEEIERRIRSRVHEGEVALVGVKDYRMFKDRIRKPVFDNVLEVDTSQGKEICEGQILSYLETGRS